MLIGIGQSSRWHTTIAMCLLAWVAGTACRDPHISVPPSAAAASTSELGVASIPPPFEPVRVRRDAAAPGQFEVQVWGRRYEFAGGGPLPSRVLSQGESLFVEAPVFVLRRGPDAGAVAWSETRVVEERPDRIDLVSEGRRGGVRLTARTRIEYDGMVRVDLRLAADQELRIDGFFYDLQLDPAVARFYNHHVPYDYASLRVDKRRLIASAGRLPQAPHRFEFVPTLAIGNRHVGIEWWSETNVGWTGPPGRGPIELTPTDHGTRLRIEPIAAPRTLRADSPWEHSFALFPAPLRPPPEDWRSVRFTSASQAPRYDRRIGTRFFWIAFPAHFDARWHGLPTSRASSKQQRELRQRLQRWGVGYIPYAKLTAAPSLHPTVMENASRWSATRRLFTGTGGEQRRFLEARGWKPGQPYSYSVCMAHADYAHWMLEQSLDAFRDESLAGLYYDWGAINEPCEQHPTVRDRKTDQVWPYFGVREFYKRLYAAVKAQDPRAPIAIHTQGQPRSLAAFVDYVFVGEALNILFRDGRSFPEIRANPSLYDPDYYALPSGFLEAQFFPRVGGVMQLLPEIRHARDPSNPGRERKLTRAFFARVLVDDIPVWLTNTHPEERVRIFQAIDRLGGLSGATVHPWWANRDQIRREPELRVTAYARAGKLLLIAANWTGRPIETRIAFDPAQFGLDRVARVRDAEAPRRSALSWSQGGFSIAVPPRDLRIVLVE